MFVTMKLWDMMLVAEYREDFDQARNPETNRCPSIWHVTVTDEMTARARTGKWTDTEMSAVMALMMGGGEEGLPAKVTAELYKIAEPLFEGHVRPIP